MTEPSHSPVISDVALATVTADLAQVEADLKVLRGEQEALTAMFVDLRSKREGLLAVQVEAGSFDGPTLFRMKGRSRVIEERVFEEVRAASVERAHVLHSQSWLAAGAPPTSDGEGPFGVEVAVYTGLTDENRDLFVENLRALFERFSPVAVKAEFDPFDDDVARWGVSILDSDCSENYSMVLWWDPATDEACIADLRARYSGPAHRGSVGSMMALVAERYTLDT